MLEVSEHASTEDIRAAHGRQVDGLLAQRAHLSAADLDLRMQVLKLALSTLTSAASRYAYDTQLAHERAAQRTQGSDAGSVDMDAGGSGAWSKPLLPEAQALLRKARRADEPEEERLSPLVWLLSNLKSSVTKSLVFIGLLAVMGMVLQMMFMRSAWRESPSERMRSAEDQAVIQEYYQTYGVRPASREEAELLMRENQRKEAEEREAQRQRQMVEQQRLDFESESRRRAEEVSAALRRSEEEALQRALQKP